MKGFGIYIKNDLLEPKHVKNMSDAYWLFSWLIDKLTSISEDGVGKVLGGKPIKYEEVAKDLGISESTYTRWIARLKKHGYIDNQRTPYGLIISVYKAKKTFNERSVNYEGTENERSVKSDGLDPSKVTDKIFDSDGSNKDNTVDNTVRQNNVTTNVVTEKPQYGNQDINELSHYFLTRMGIPLEDCPQKQSRQYWYLLIKESKSGVDGVKWLIDRAAEDSWYKRNITSSKDLYYKRVKIISRKVGHVEKFAVMKGGEDYAEARLVALEDSGGNTFPDQQAEGLLSSGNQ